MCVQLIGAEPTSRRITIRRPPIRTNAPIFGIHLTGRGEALSNALAKALGSSHLRRIVLLPAIIRTGRLTSKSPTNLQPVSLSGSTLFPLEGSVQHRFGAEEDKEDTPTNAANCFHSPAPKHPRGWRVNSARHARVSALNDSRSVSLNPSGSNR